MFNNEIRRMLIKQALIRAGATKRAYTPPPPGGDPNAMGGMPPGMDPSMMGGMPPMGGGAGGGMPPGGDPSMMGGMPPMGGDMGGMPPMGGDMGGMPPMDMSGVDPSMDAAPGGGEAKAQLQSALAVLREGIKQMEKAVEALAGGSGAPSEGAPKEASFRGYGYYNVDPVQRLVLFLNSLDY